MHNLNPNEPSGPIENRWEKHLFDLALIAPQNRKKYNIIVIGTGLAGASLCATLGEATMSNPFVTMTVPEGRTLLLRKVE